MLRSVNHWRPSIQSKSCVANRVDRGQGSRGRISCSMGRMRALHPVLPPLPRPCTVAVPSQCARRRTRLMPLIHEGPTKCKVWALLQVRNTWHSVLFLMVPPRLDRTRAPAFSAACCCCCSSRELVICPSTAIVILASWSHLSLANCRRTGVNKEVTAVSPGLAPLLEGLIRDMVRCKQGHFPATVVDCWHMRASTCYGAA